MAVNVGKEGDAFLDINMTPLIDVMLVLLIIFIITIPVMTNAVKIDNPPPNPNPPATPPEVIDISIDFDGTLMWNKTPVDRKTMEGYIIQESAKDPQPEVHITVDKFAKYEKVAQTLADLQRNGLKKIGFVNNELF
ncbi:MAG: biopolymer transporter ExbD [Proteobacteria bacterium]|nr:biopolymer transporter ExbD [Pseudomonadota bacterium]